MYVTLNCPGCGTAIHVSSTDTEATCAHCSRRYVFYVCKACLAPVRVGGKERKFVCPWCGVSHSLSMLSQPARATAATVSADIRRYDLDSSDPLVRRMGGLILIASHGATIPIRAACAVTCTSDGIVIVPADRRIPEVRYPYGELVSFEVGGPGMIQSGGGFIGGGFGLAGAAEGMAVAAVLNSFTTRTSVHTLLRITADAAYYVFFTSLVTPAALGDHFGLVPSLIEKAKQKVSAAPLDVADQIRKLAELRNAGILDEQEFAAAKAKLLTELIG